LSTRVAVISDVHGNLHALEAVLAAIERERPDAVWFLGDAVGYGPRPNECCAALASRADVGLCGNHDLVVLGKLSIEDFSFDAAAAALWSQQALEPAARAFLEPLQPRAAAEDVELFHGSARDPVWEYVLSEDAALATLQATSSPLVLVGHSHVPLALELSGDGVGGGVAPAGAEVALGDGRWLLNPGSVGQPRDGDPRAAFLLLEPGVRASFRRVEYPLERTQAELLEAGLPDGLAARLAHGL
jgi:predicted phosphodiesterase